MSDTVIDLCLCTRSYVQHLFGDVLEIVEEHQKVNHSITHTTVCIKSVYFQSPSLVICSILKYFHANNKEYE